MEINCWQVCSKSRLSEARSVLEATNENQKPAPGELKRVKGLLLL